MTLTTVKRIHNFSAGPATLPLEVLEIVQRDFLNFNNTGMSIIEMSHRSKDFTKVIEHTEAQLRKLLGIPENYAVLFLQGGASLQFSMVPMNLNVPGKPMDLISTGVWSKKAIKEIEKVGQCRVIASSEDKNFSYIPKFSDSDVNQDAAFLHITSNNTIAGTQWKHFPNSGNVPLVADMSSDILSKRFDVTKFKLIYAGAQKNIGPSGVTLVIIDKELAERADKKLPTMLQYRTHIADNSLYNTPSTFGIYMIGLVADWIESIGGLEAMEKRNEQKAAKLYKAIDDSDFYSNPVDLESRSLMNVVFRIKGNNEDLEAKFVQEATAAGLSGLKGHRLVGGLRASIYNALSPESIDALVEFMVDFENRHKV